jgi:hypothetical protein
MASLKRNQEPKMKRTAAELIDAINALRTAAGHAPRHFAGTSRNSLQVILNLAQRGEFA